MMPLLSQLCPWQQDRVYPPCEPPALLTLTGHRADRALLLPGTTRASPESAEPSPGQSPARV